jgi:hypothetical protein
LAQIFPPGANRVPIQILIILGVAAAAAPGVAWYFFSPEYTDVGYRPEQPVAFSHLLHAGELSIDCRYCHTTVERAAVASVPPTQTCMNCHQLVGRDLPSLEPLRASATSGEPLFWVRVHKVPEYAYFPHDVHVRAGVGCSSCHGDVAAMDRVMQMEPLSMRWCLDCHRDPTDHLRPEDALTDMRWQPPADQEAFAAARIEALGLAPPEDCGACHR